MNNRFTIPALLAALLLGGSFAAAQTAGSAPVAGAPGSKMAILDVNTAIASTAEGKQAAAELQSQFAPKRSELENIQKSLEDIQNRLRTGERTLSDEERDRLQRQGERLQGQYQRKQKELQDEFNDARGEVFERLGRKLADVINRYARENGYSVVLDVSQACTIYCNPQLDVTQDIIRLYDQANPVKGASAAPGAKPATPAQPRPAPGQPAKPKP
jgi:outer membrane protein